MMQMKLSVLTTTAVAIVVGVEAFANLCDGKKILLSFDGTGNSPFNAYNPDTIDPKTGNITDQSISSVLKLHLLAGGSVDNQHNEIDDQVCIYQKGIGTISKYGAKKALNKFRGILGHQIKPMRKKLEDVYEKDDKIYVIGFSRGAAAARKFVSNLDKRGIHTATTKEFVKRPEVAFLGCFDTVSMQYGDRFHNIVGRSLKCKFLDLIGKHDYVPKHKRSSVTVGEKDGKISDIVDRAVHNVALDDDRMSWPFPLFFPPILMDSGNPKVSEVWFAGEHGDVGGAYHEKSMSDYSLLHMKEWMEEAGLAFLNPDGINEESLKVKDHPDVKILPDHLRIVPDAVSGKLHLHNFTNPSYRPAFAATDDNRSVLPDGKVKVHESVLLYAQQQSEKTPYVLNPLLSKLAKSTENVVVVGRHGKELVEQTKTFRKLLLQQNSTSDI